MGSVYQGMETQVILAANKQQAKEEAKRTTAGTSAIVWRHRVKGPTEKISGRMARFAEDNITKD